MLVNNKLSLLQINSKIAAFLVAFLCLISSAWATENAQPSELNINNLQHPSELILASGQPDEAAFSALAKKGVEVVLNLRPHSELDWNEQATVESLGMSYINLPVAGADGVTFENAKKLQALLNELQGKQVLVHCSSGNRVGALAALNAFEQNGKNVEEAIETGKKWGLTRLEPLVREKLTQ